MGPTAIVWRIVTRPWLVAAVLTFILLGAILLSALRRPQEASRITPRMRCANNLNQIAKALVTYQGDNGGFFPYDDRGPLHSISLLYPDYLDRPSVFVCPVASRKGRLLFPDGCSLADHPCSYGFRWPMPSDAPSDLVIAADMPGNHDDGFSVLFADFCTRWSNSPFCSHDPTDNIFSPEPGWSPDTDSYIRQIR